jgi:SAM-dependent methyltransferase
MASDDPEFDFDELFDADYLRFYERFIDEETSDAETELIAELIDLRPGERVLDVACGHGRIANRLAEYGASVTGIDRTPYFLDLARAAATKSGHHVDYTEGDMRALGFEAEFDVVVSWFTSFGYFDDDTNRRVLGDMARALKPGGRLILETINRDVRTLSVEESANVKEVDGDFMIDQCRFEPLDSRLYVRRFITRSGSPTREMRFFMRLFTFTELRDWFTAAGLSNVRGFGGEGEVLRVDSARMITVGQRP